jgi:uncharacterized protein YlxW (UPF0749 family)
VTTVAPFLCINIVVMSLALMNESAKILAETSKKNERLQAEDAQILEQMQTLAQGIEAYRKTYESYKRRLNHNYTFQLTEMNQKVYKVTL